MIDMNGIDFKKGPEGGIYLMGHDTTAAQVRRGGGGLFGNTKVKGWDGGRFVPGDTKTSADALKLTGLDWLVERHPIVKLNAVMGVNPETKLPEVIGWEPRKSDEAPAHKPGSQKMSLPHCGWDIVPNETMNVRADTGEVLGIVGPGWTNDQNHEAFTFVDDLVDSGEAKFLAGGEKGGGRKVWLAAQLDREMIIGGAEDEISIPILFFSNGWDGFTPLSVTVAPYRLACLNGQTIPLEGCVRNWKARHTSGLKAEARIAEARKTLELSIAYLGKWEAAMNQMFKAKLTDKQVLKTLTQIFPDAPLDAETGEPRKRAQANVEATRDEVLTIFRDQPDLQNLPSSKYRLWNAVTEYADWHVKAPDADVEILRSAEAHPLKDKTYKILVGA
jgi:phage/plasmid-like protein (TIGR03299 family)